MFFALLKKPLKFKLCYDDISNTKKINNFLKKKVDINNQLDYIHLIKFRDVKLSLLTNTSGA